MGYLNGSRTSHMMGACQMHVNSVVKNNVDTFGR